MGAVSQLSSYQRFRPRGSLGGRHSLAEAVGEGATREYRKQELSPINPLAKKQISCYATRTRHAKFMSTKPKEKTFTLNTIIDGHIIRGQVRFSPAPVPGIMTEIARLDAERLLAQVVRDEIADGRL